MKLHVYSRDQGESDSNGFTLVELSIVLVIVGLLISGIMIGKELIELSRVRSQVSQIEKYRTAVNAFRTKYNCLPGDCASATKFGLKARGAVGGTGDGNGIMEGNWGGFAGNQRGHILNGENTMFFDDLSTVGLINETFSLASNTVPWGTYDSTNLGQVYPKGAVKNTYFVVFSSGGANNQNGANYFGLISIATADHSGYQIGLGQAMSTASLPVRLAYQIDSKTDDGLPRTGKVRAQKPRTEDPNAAIALEYNNNASDTVPSSGNTTSCFDNNANVANPVIYSTRFSDGNGEYCSLAFEW